MNRYLLSGKVVIFLAGGIDSSFIEEDERLERQLIPLILLYKILMMTQIIRYLYITLKVDVQSRFPGSKCS